MKKVLIVLILISFSCKEKSNKIVEEKQSAVKINSYLSVTLKAVVTEDDEFHLYYSEDVFGQYQPENFVKVAVKASVERQEIIFILPDGVYPIKLRMDVGSKAHLTPIQIEQIKLSSGLNEKIIDSSTFNSIFKPNKYLEKIDGSNSYSRTPIDGVYDPFFISISIDEMVMNLF